MYLYPMHGNIPLLLLLLLLIELRQCSALRLNNLAALRKKVEPLHPVALPQSLTYSSSSSRRLYAGKSAIASTRVQGSAGKVNAVGKRKSAITKGRKKIPKNQSDKKYVLVTGGVISGIGKGITASSIGVLLKMLGQRTTAIKIDPYLNVDAGTMSPLEHGKSCYVYTML